MYGFGGRGGIGLAEENDCAFLLGLSPVPELRFRGNWVDVGDDAFAVPAIGNDSPRNLPRLATPTPHVRVVL